jgi:outer membrane protein assembly factor BamB
MLKVILMVFALVLSACSGEKYDISKAINILPERNEAFFQAPELAKINIFVEGNAYKGLLNKRKIAKLKSLNSNFEISDDAIFYITSSRKLVKINGDERLEVSFKNALSKKKNSTQNLLAVNGQIAIITTFNGDILAFNTENLTLMWKQKIDDVISLKPFIYKDEVIIATSAGAIHVFDGFTGEKKLEIEKVEDPLGMNFNTISNLKPLPIYPANIFISYYRNDLLFFDIATKVKLHSAPLIVGNLEFAKITSDPIFYDQFVFTSTSYNISATSLVNGLKAWGINGNFTSNIVSSGGFVFAFEANSQNIIAFSAKTGDIKWKTELKLPKKTSKIWLTTFVPNAIIAIDEKGNLTKLNISNGKIFEDANPHKFFSPKFNYALISGKIYYTDGSDNLNILE